MQESPEATPTGSTGVEPHPHRQTALQLWEAIASGNSDALREVLAPKTVWRMYGRSPLAGSYIGADAVLGLMAEVGERCDTMRAELVDVFVSERGAAMRYAIDARRGAHRLEIEHVLITRIACGKIVEAIFAPLDQEKYDRFWLAD